MGELKEAIAKVTKYRGGKALSSFKITYDSQTSQLEPIYYWLLDFIQGMGIKVEKVTDNFMSSPGSGHFSEMNSKVTRMQEEGMKMSGLLNQTIKSVLNLLYDLKEFEIRLGHYKDAHSDDKQTKEAGGLALKQIWLDNVDMKRGRGAIHQMANEMGFTTLREAFMVANTIDDLKKMSGKDGVINEQVMRILIPRLTEYTKWKEYSEKELDKRFKIEKSYLRSQVDTVKLQTSWIRPYLKAAADLRQRGFGKDPALVAAFSTTMFNLTLLGKKKINFESAVKSGDLPPGFLKKKMRRDYYSCVVVDLVFRGHVSQRATQRGDMQFAMGGKVDILFDSYALNEEELKLLDKERAKQDMEEGLNFAEEASQVSLEQLKEDIDHFLGDDGEKEEEKKEKKDQDNLNPFSALLGMFKPSNLKKNKKEIGGIKDIKKDNFIEKSMRDLAVKGAKGSAYAIYDIYKKAHGFESSTENFDNNNE
jgi:hypothetical protein